MKNNKRPWIAIALLVAFGLWLVFTVLPKGTNSTKGGRIPSPERVEPRFTKEAELSILDSSGALLKHFDIELAESAAEIQYGMMYRKQMDPNTGMLFLMGQERRQSFYMKNTYVSLDIIYINDAMEIVSIQKNAKPLDETSLPSTGPASLVLELKGGLSDQLGIEPGMKVQWNRIP
jgi:uncharacterized membrane protein (UPF0127 family)